MKNKYKKIKRKSQIIPKKQQIPKIEKKREGQKWNNI